MKKFIHLNIYGKEEDLIVLLNKLKTQDSKEFSLDKVKTEDYALNVFRNKDMVACFKSNLKKHFDSTIWLAIVDSKLSIANIVSSSISSLGIERYNFILKDFWENFFKPITDENKYKVKITNEIVTIEDLVDPNVVRALNMWESTCNKSYPISHPNDRERWFNFLKVSIESRSILPLEDLEKWLIEDKKWYIDEDETVSNLMRDYEYGMDLLKFYTGLKDE